MLLVCILVSPSQIFCKYYLYLMEKLQPIQVSKMLYYKRIFSYHDLDAILNMPIDHMKSFYIIEYFRLMGAAGILEFVDILNVISSQKEISSILRNGEMILHVHSLDKCVRCTKQTKTKILLIVF